MNTKFKPGNKVRFKTIKEIEREGHDFSPESKRLQVKNQGIIFTVVSSEEWEFGTVLEIFPDPPARSGSHRYSVNRFKKINKIELNQKLFIL